MGFMMIKKESAKCGEIMMRYYTLRLFGEGKLAKQLGIFLLCIKPKEDGT